MSPSLQTRVDASSVTDEIPVIATLRRQVHDDAYDGHPTALLRALRRTAASSQAGVVDGIDAPVKRFWLVNAIAFSGTPDEIRQVAADPAVDTVDIDVKVHLTADAHASSAAPFPDAAGGDWGLAAIKAPTVWSTYGLRGAGVTIGSIDTGVNANHPDLAGKIVAWHDFANGSPTPIDENGHGTHTAGTLVGGSAGGAPIGVAPDAHLVVARAMGADGVGSGSALLAAAEWMTDPDGNPATADQPSVINNSWSASTANDTWFRPMIRRWLDLGIVPVFAAGNNGPSTGSVASPAGYPEAIAVGAIDTDQSVPPFSARGPVVWQNTDGLGPVAGTVLAKPDLVAPGVGVTSSVGSGYLAYSGTSMAAPHVAGVAALVREANPSLSPQAVGDILRMSADDIGTPGVDPSSGYGRLDAMRAVEAAAGPAPDTRFVTAPPAVTNARTLTFTLALSSGGTAARIRVDGGDWTAPSPETTVSLALPEGRHVVEAQAVDASGVVDATPARSTVTVDRTKPKVRIRLRRSGRSTTFRSTISDALSGPVRGSVRWSFGAGQLSRGATVTKRFAEGGRRRVVLTARDAAGNESYATRVFRPRAASAVRGLAVPRVASRRGRALAIAGRLVRPATVRVTLRRVRTPTVAATARGLAATFTAPALSPPLRRAALAGGRAQRFRVRVRVRGLKRGRYLVEVSAAERGTTLGRLHMSRTVRIR